MNWNEIFDYADGKLYWKIQPRTRTVVGSEAGSIKNDGYLRIKYNGHEFLAHRIIWEMHNGLIPDSLFIDHINHDKSDNRICNLRIASPQDNQRNRSKNKSNSSGITGVYWNKKAAKWHSQIRVNGVRISLGFYENIECAAKARASAESMYGFHRNHGK